MIMEELLKLHASRYPLMQPTDAVKLIYQNEFGVGHLISDRALFIERLRREADSIHEIRDISLTESIGNGLIRVMLNSPKSCQLSLDGLAAVCIKTAEKHRGTLDCFLKKIEELEAACKKSVFQFSENDLSVYLHGYRSEGYPPVSHSSIYREAYHPAYRVISKELLPEVFQPSPKTSR